MPIDLQNFDVRTGVRLYAPKEMGVTLVPLQDVEGAEFALFWSAVFLSFSSTGLGAWLSMLASGYDNKPVVYLIALFTLIFAALAVGFGLYGFKKRKNARALAQTPEGEALNPEALSQQQERMVEDAIRIYELMKNAVFDDKTSLPIEEFKRKVALALQLQLGVDSNEKANYFVNLLRYLGIVTFENEDTENEVANFDNSWSEERLKETFEKLTGLTKASRGRS